MNDLDKWYVCDHCHAWVSSEENLVGKPCVGEYKNKELKPCPGVYRKLTEEDIDRISTPHGD